MPLINERYYMNPQYGAALERARLNDPEREFRNEFLGPHTPHETDPVPGYDARQREPGIRLLADQQPNSANQRQHLSQHPAPQQTHPAQKSPQTTQEPETPVQNANRVYNETSDLRPITKHGPGSAQDLHDARLYIAHVLENRETSGKLGIVAPENLRSKEVDAIHNYPPVKHAYNDSLKAAQGAASGVDPTIGATHYYMDYGQAPPAWAAKKTPIKSFGPFRITSGQGGVHGPKKGGKVYIRVYHLKH